MGRVCRSSRGWIGGERGGAHDLRRNGGGTGSARPVVLPLPVFTGIITALLIICAQPFFCPRRKKREASCEVILSLFFLFFTFFNFY